MHLRGLRITYCTVCRDDFDLVKQTLPANIRDNEEYGNADFIILDCSYTNQLESYISSNLSAQITSEKLVYIKGNQTSYFNCSAAKNVLARSASGEIICFIHPGHFTSQGFSDYLVEKFSSPDKLVLATETMPFHEPTRDHPTCFHAGKLCIRKDDLAAVNGFDEHMMKYGNEDVDLLNRLQNNGVTKSIITNPIYCHYINQQVGKGLSLLRTMPVDSIYISHISPASSELIYLYKDGTFEKGVLIDQPALFAEDYRYSNQSRNYPYKYKLEGIKKRGIWKYFPNEHFLQCRYNEYESFILKPHLNSRFDVLIHSTTNKTFRIVNDPWILEQLLILNNAFYNYAIMEENARLRKTRIDTTQFSGSPAPD